MPGQALRPLGAKQEGDRQRHRGARVAEVVDQVGEQSDAAAGEIDRQLSGRGDAEDRKRQADRAQTLARSLDARVDQAVRMPLPELTVAVGVGA